jgi:hypothetical protein
MWLIYVANRVCTQLAIAIENPDNGLLGHLYAQIWAP